MSLTPRLAPRAASLRRLALNRPYNHICQQPDPAQSGDGDSGQIGLAAKMRCHGDTSYTIGAASGDDS